MFPDPCGELLRQQVTAGADPKTVIPDAYFAAYGGQEPLPTSRVFSVGVGPTTEAAAAAVPHGQVRIAPVVAVRATGAIIEWVPQLSRYNTLNLQHANVSPPGAGAFAILQVPSPVPRRARIDGQQK